MFGELKLKTQEKPSIFNKDMLFYGLLAPLVLVPLSLIPGVGPTGAAIRYGTMALGGLFGGWMGKNRIERENIEGKDAKSPSFFNKEMVIGALLTIKAAGLVLGGILTMTGITPAVAVASAIGLLASFGIGGYIGGKIGHNRMEQEYEAAKKQFIIQNISRNVSPEVGQAVQYTMEHKKDWGKEVLEKELLAAAQQQPQR